MRKYIVWYKNTKGDQESDMCYANSIADACEVVRDRQWDFDELVEVEEM